jgi:hypothetical protein
MAAVLVLIGGRDQTAAVGRDRDKHERPEKRLVYPWAKGLKVEEIQAYYDQAKFKDWTHADTGAPVLKAQHPEFEMWSQGIHARSGVTCADCHMPYKREGALKISDHHVRSPCSTSIALARLATNGRRKSSRRGSRRFRNVPTSCVIWL